MAVADDQFVGHAHAAVHLDHLMAKRDTSFGDKGARAVDCAAARRRIARHRRQIEQAARLFQNGILRDHPVLQGLKTAQRRAELVARTQIIERVGKELFHDPQRFGAIQKGAAFERRFNCRQIAAKAIFARQPRHCPASAPPPPNHRPAAKAGR